MDDMEGISDEMASYPYGSSKLCQLNKLHIRKSVRYIEARIRANECSGAPPPQFDWYSELRDARNDTPYSCY